MTTERKKEAARANGAKSRGPVTAEGKARSSKNATTHGLTAQTVVLPGESEERFHAILESMLEAYAPSTDYEVSLVEKMAALNWQQDRLLGIDTVTLAVQMDVIEPALNAEVENLSTPTLIALAYRDLSDNSRVLSNLDRHASRIRRQFNQLRIELLALQKARTEKLQNEPTAEQPSSDPGSGLPSPDSSTKFQNEPTGEQTSAPEQHTSSKAESGASATGPASRPPAAMHPSSESDSPLPSPDCARKLPNEPNGRQTPIDQPIASSEAA